MAFGPMANTVSLRPVYNGKPKIRSPSQQLRRKFEKLEGNPALFVVDNGIHIDLYPPASIADETKAVLQAIAD